MKRLEINIIKLSNNQAIIVGNMRNYKVIETK